MASPLALIAAGGTGGHMFPAQALAEVLLAEVWEPAKARAAREREKLLALARAEGLEAHGLSVLARLERLNFLGDVSANGLCQSHGLMVNYLYALDEIEANHEAFAEKGVVAAAPEVKKLLSLIWPAAAGAGAVRERVLGGGYQHLARPVLFRLGGGDAETAHHTTLQGAAAAARVPGLLRVVAAATGGLAPGQPAGGGVVCAGVAFGHRVGLAAGVDKDGTALLTWQALGLGCFSSSLCATMQHINLTG